MTRTHHLAATLRTLARVNLHIPNEFGLPEFPYPTRQRLVRAGQRARSQRLHDSDQLVRPVVAGRRSTELHPGSRDVAVTTGSRNQATMGPWHKRIIHVRRTDDGGGVRATAAAAWERALPPAGCSRAEGCFSGPPDGWSSPVHNSAASTANQFCHKFSLSGGFTASRLLLACPATAACRSVSPRQEYHNRSWRPASLPIRLSRMPTELRSR
jgi:hypothetical protein